jgi:SAM-dependent methyltransferase
MQEFVRDWIVPLAEKHGWRSFCEIGASMGLSTNELLRLTNISHTIVDPCIDADLALKYAGDKRVTVQKGNSLDVLPHLDGSFDCILIDGDHNWYTVFNELRLIRERALLPPGGTIFFHDVGWPYGRRDMYYQPDTVPPEYRLEYARKGIVQGQSRLEDSKGRSRNLCNAVREGGPRNGVLTAIEDFVAEYPTEYHFCRVRHQFGLGILQYRTRKRSDDLSFLVLRIKVGIYNLPRLMWSSLKKVVRAIPGLMRTRNR